jgi:hypothetical protein
MSPGFVPSPAGPFAFIKSGREICSLLPWETIFLLSPDAKTRIPRHAGMRHQNTTDARQNVVRFSSASRLLWPRDRARRWKRG